MKNKLEKFLCAVVIQVVILAGLIGYNLVAGAGGQLVMLRVRPIDPTDPLRGDYMVINYDINRLNAYLIREYPVMVGDEVFVELVKTGNYYEPVGVHTTQPGGDKIFISGLVTAGQIYGPDDTYQRSLEIHYGIEQFFIPEGKGRGLTLVPSNTAVLVSVSPDGTPAVRDVLIGGRSITK